jgi:hypothetical protein
MRLLARAMRVLEVLADLFCDVGVAFVGLGRGFVCTGGALRRLGGSFTRALDPLGGLLGVVMGHGMFVPSAPRDAHQPSDG